MHITMVKKRLANGEPCEKCAQTEEMLRRRNYWDRIDEVVWAVEGEPESEGHRIGAKHGITVAPFFVLRDDDGSESAITSPLRLIKQYFAEEAKNADVRPKTTTETVDLKSAQAALAGASAEEVLRFVLERFGDRAALAFSGAEEIVMIDMATRMGLEVRAFTLDTGRLHAETYGYLDDVRRRYGITLDVYFPDTRAVTEFVQSRGVNSFYQEGHRACCAIRKVAPLARALAGCEAWVTGRRREPSLQSRIDLPVVEQDLRHQGPNGPLLTFNPLAGWDHDAVWRYIAEHDVPYNPLHDQGFTSIGCEPCTRAVGDGQPPRAGRWWWEEEGSRESGLCVGGEGI